MFSIVLSAVILFKDMLFLGILHLGYSRKKWILFLHGFPQEEDKESDKLTLKRSAFRKLPQCL